MLFEVLARIHGLSVDVDHISTTVLRLDTTKWLEQSRKRTVSGQHVDLASEHVVDLTTPIRARGNVVKDLTWSDLGKWTFLNDSLQDLVGVDRRKSVERGFLSHWLETWNSHNWTTRVQGEGGLGNGLVNWLLPVVVE